MALRFHKMHGAGNDFVLIDLRPGAQPGNPVEFGAADSGIFDVAQVRAWGDRHRGIGFDQLLVLAGDPDPEIAAKVHIWNADGSTAEQCGNGMRAIGLYLAEVDPRRTAGQRRFTVQGPVARIHLESHESESTGAEAPQASTEGIVSVGMGSPAWAPADIPLADLEQDEHGTASLVIDGASVRFGALSMGNPHAVVEVPDVSAAPVRTLGKALREHPAFPHSCNVGFAEVIDHSHLRLRVLERGAGETLACGSGACAAVAWLTRRGRVDGRVRVSQGGGTLWVETDRGIGPVTLTGPAAHVFEGTLA